MIFDVYDQRPPVHIARTKPPEYEADVVNVGDVEASTGSEAIAEAKRLRMCASLCPMVVLVRNR